jgi:hypothetical protein
MEVGFRAGRKHCLFGERQLLKGLSPWRNNDGKTNFNTYLNLISRSRMPRLAPFHMQLRGILLDLAQVKLNI